MDPIHVQLWTRLHLPSTTPAIRSHRHTDLEPTEHWSCVPTGAVLEQRADLESWHAWRGRQTGVLAGKTRWPQVCRCSRRSPQTRKRRLSRRRQRCAVSDHGPPNWTQRHRRTADHRRVLCSECDCSPVMPDHRSSTTLCWLHSSVVNDKTTVTELQFCLLVELRVDYIHFVSKNALPLPLHILNNSAKNEPILIIVNSFI